MLKQFQKVLIDQTFEERHYHRSMRMHKECFDAFGQFHTERVTGQSRLNSVFLKIFRTQKRITKGFKTTFNKTFCLMFFLPLF